MKRLTFCERCRGIEVGWNGRYLLHGMMCAGGLARSLRAFSYALSAAVVVVVFPGPAGMSSAPARPSSALQQVTPPDLSGPVESTEPVPDPSVHAIEDLVGRHSRLSDEDTARIARAVVASAREHDVDPFLVASILLVESSGNRFAISGRDAVGIMQIHVPTWGALVEAEGINLFRIEDNVDLGTRILKEYTRRYGLWHGVARYLGADPAHQQAVTYVSRVQGIYGDRLGD